MKINRTNLIKVLTKLHDRTNLIKNFDNSVGLPIANFYKHIWYSHIGWFVSGSLYITQIPLPTWGFLSGGFYMFYIWGQKKKYVCFQLIKIIKTVHVVGASSFISQFYWVNGSDIVTTITMLMVSYWKMTKHLYVGAKN